MQLKYLGAAVGSFLVLAACTSGGSKTGKGGDGGAVGQGGGDASGGSAQPGSGGDGAGGSAEGGTTAGGTGGTTLSGGAGGSSGGTGGGGGTSTGGARTGGTANTGGTPNTGGVATGMPCATDPRCDDLEKYNAGSKPGGEFQNFSENGGSFSISADKAFSGTKALKFTVPTGNGKSVRMQHKGYGLLPRDEIFMRAMVFVETRIAGQDPFHWNIMQVEGNTGNIVTGGNNSYKTFQHGIVGGRDCFSHGGNLVPVGRWVCWEFHVNGKTEDVQSFFDGKLDIFTEISQGEPVPGGSGCLGSNASGWAIPNVQRPIFGFSSAHPMTTPVTIYLDDIALSDKRIGCPSKP